MTNFNWYVVYTKPRCELKVASLLARKNIRNYCPLHIVENQFPDSRKVLLEPLFTSFVFVYIPETAIASLLSFPGIVNYLYWLNNPVTVEEEEINSLVRLSKEYNNLKLEKCLIRKGPTNLQDKQDFPSSPVTNVSGNNEKIVLPSLGYYVIASSSLTE